jgi:mannose-6-phosphate isomerase-like protein (cupin superfamily)
MRFEREGFVTLEKEVSVKAGAPLAVSAALTPAPPPPPPPKPAAPPPAPKPAAPVLTPGEPRVISIPDFAEKQLITNKETTKETPIGCSGATATRLLQARSPIAAHTHADADEVLYVVAGDAMLTLGGKEYRMQSGALAIVPRGMEHAITRRSGGPVILISTVGGPPCS